jgi:hypothetical protein
LERTNGKAEEASRIFLFEEGIGVIGEDIQRHLKSSICCDAVRLPTIIYWK